jgi:hypothetical protein
MALPTTVGIYVRQGGVWERANAGTPTGFSGPQVRQAGVWENASSVQTKVSGTWEFGWVNIDGEINLQDVFTSDFDVSPYTLSAFIRYNPDGTIDRKHNGTITNDYTQWRYYDCGREYEIWFETSIGSSYITSEPTLDTWLTFTDGGTSKSVATDDTGIGFFVDIAEWTVRIREAVSAPAGGNDLGNARCTISAEI